MLAKKRSGGHHAGMSATSRSKYEVFVGTEKGLFAWPEERLMGDLDVWGLGVAPDGALLIGSRRAGELLRLADGQVTSVSEGVFRLFAAAPDDPSFLLGGTLPVGLAVSLDGGHAWRWRTRIHKAVKAPFPEDHYVRGIAFAPDEPDIVYVGVEGLGKGGVLVSRDRANTWRWTGMDRDIHALACPGDPNILYAASGSGFFVTEDGGDTWEQRSHGLRRNYPMCLYMAPKGDLYMGVAEDPPPYWDRQRQANACLYRMRARSNRWEEVIGPGGGAFTALAGTPTGEIWAGRADGILYRGKGKNFEEVGELPARILSIAIRER